MTTSHVYKVFIVMLCMICSLNVTALEFNGEKILQLTGKNNDLKADEGYLLLSVDNADKIDNFAIKPVNKGNKIKFNDILPGENFALIKLKAGEYYWDVFMYFSGSIPLRYEYKKNEKTFKVEPGVINYPGTWSSKSLMASRSHVIHYFDSHNKSAHELNKLKSKFQTIYEAYPFKFQGPVRDHYPDFFKQVTTTKNIAKTDINDYASYDIKEGTKDELNSYPEIENYLVNHSQSIGHFNPMGQYLLFSIVVDNVSLIRILNLSNYDMITLFQQELPKGSYVDDIKWVDNNTIYYSIRYKGALNHRIAHLEISPDLQIVGAKKLQIQLDGLLVDALPDQQDTLYFAKKSRLSKRQNGLYKIDVSSQKSINKTIRKPHQIVKKLKDAAYSLTAKDGEIRFIVTTQVNKKQKNTIFDYWFLPPNDKWQKIYSTTSEDSLQLPHAISSDYQHFYVLTNQFSDKKAIHRFSTSSFEHEGVFYEDESKELINVVMDQSHEIIGVSYYEGGFVKTQYLENDNDALNPLRSQFPNHKFYNAQHNLQSHKVLVFATNQYSKGSWSIYDTQSQKIDKLFELNPKYSTLKKGVFHTINITASDGVELEGYLMVPENINNHQTPLVVMPHGGPIGIRDDAYNADMQHFYASQGIATLKVNYRGSGGFGKQFEQAGQQQWGEKIESDINEMATHVIQKFDLSEHKVCAMGASYGGYSALMLTLLYPQRYQCAISIMGVTDIPLIFSSSDFSKSEKLVSEFKKIVGDPEIAYQQLIDKSPVYLAEKFTKPVLLMHGKFDRRVTPEHALRMKQSLDIHDKSVELIMLQNEGHSFSNLESRVVYVARSLDFIKQSLNIQ